MEFRPGYTVLAIAIGVMLILAVPVNSVFAQEQVKTQSMITAQGQQDDATQLRLRLRSQLKKETGLSDEELDAVDPLLAEALSLNGGDTEPIRKMVRKSVQIDCVGECLLEKLRTQNRLMLQEHKELAEDAKVASRDRLRIQTRTMDGEQSGEMTRTETQTQTQNQDGSGGGSGKGEGKGK